MTRLLSILFTLATASAAQACWTDVPLDRIIGQSHVVVIGKVTRVDVAEVPKRKDQYRFDTAQITVQEVLRNTLPDYPIAAKQDLPLSMPSITNSIHVSTDLRYHVGKTGIWILTYRDKSFWATYPKDFQPLSSEKAIRELIGKLRQTQ